MSRSEICFLVVSSNYSFVHKGKTQIIPLFVVVLVRVGEGGGCLPGFCCLVCLLVCGFVVVVVCCWFCVVVGVGGGVLFFGGVGCRSSKCFGT